MSDNRLHIIKVPIGRKIISREPHFPPLNSLELNLLENPDLLKIGAPLIPTKPIKRIVLRKAKEPRKRRSRNSTIDDEDGLTQQFGGDDSGDESDISIKAKKSRDRPKDDHKDIELEENEDSGEEESEDSEDDSGEESEEESEDSGDDSGDEDEKETPEEKDEREKGEYIRKLKLLKKQYPTRNIPEFNEFTDVKTLKKAYSDEMWDINVDENLQSYRFYLVMSWLGMEFASTKFMGIDMEGMTSYHVRRMQRYDKLLIELGEKSYSRLGASLPVEIRLIGLVLFESLAFYVGKQIIAKGGENIGAILGMMDMTNVNQTPQSQPQSWGQQFSSQFAGPQTSTEQGEKKSRVRGPSITPEQIRNMAKP